MPGPAFAEGTRVSLHPVADEDHDAIQRDMNDPAVRIPGGGPAGPFTGEDVASFLDGFGEGGDVALVAVREGEYAGLLTLRTDSQTEVGTLGVWVTPRAQGAGVAREACSLLFDWAFDHLGVHKVAARVFAFNDASRALVDSLGLSEEGVHREERYADGAYHDAHYFGLLAGEWRARRGDGDA
ncbi:GNAT family N-acetyltransferase [Halomarina litorea]|uniref:GNAT family N-acetyltransferase n=1 Tax=Halomarina litorea TaxID=2961595 RepID=UPI0020C3366F|nr:GNAT family protein [Halomarina sp. BCD28]